MELLDLVDLVTGLGAVIPATFIPLSLGFLTPRLLTEGTELGPRVVAALASASAGIIFWFFLDVMGDAALLDVNQGFRADDYTQAASHLAIALLFAIGLTTLLWIERRVHRKTGSSTDTTDAVLSGLSVPFSFGVATLAALAVGLHALGEGIQIGASLPRSADILDAIGGVGPGVAYVLHKLLEGFVIGTFAVLGSSFSKSKTGLLGAIVGLPTIIGFIAGFLWIFYAVAGVLDSSYFFALGAAGAMYIEFKLIPVFARTRLEYASIAPALLGFYAMYLAGLFHS